MNTEVTADMNFLGKTVGTGKRYELFGLLRWGDSGRASYEGEYDDNFFGNERIRCTKQAAVFNALQGQDDSYLIDPQFRTTDNDFLIFKSTKTEVSGQRVAKENYRQIKRFTTDRSETTPIPYTYSVKRNGVEVTSISASRDIPVHVTDTINVVEAGNKVSTVLNKGQPKTNNYNTNSNSSQSLRDQLNDYSQRIQDLQKRY